MTSQHPGAPPVSRPPSVPGHGVAAQRPGGRRRPPLSVGLQSALLAVAGVRTGSTVLDLTPGASLVRAAHAAAGRSGVVLVAQPSALVESVPFIVRGAPITHAFAALPGSRLLTALRPVLRPGARVAVTGADEEAVREAALVAAFDIVHLEAEVEGFVVAALRPRPPS